MQIIQDYLAVIIVLCGLLGLWLGNKRMKLNLFDWLLMYGLIAPSLLELIYRRELQWPGNLIFVCLNALASGLGLVLGNLAIRVRSCWNKRSPDKEQ